MRELNAEQELAQALSSNPQLGLAPGLEQAIVALRQRWQKGLASAVLLLCFAAFSVNLLHGQASAPKAGGVQAPGSTTTGVVWGTAVRVADQAGWAGINSDVNLYIANICTAYGGSGVHVSVGGGMLPTGTAAATYGYSGQSQNIVLFGSNINPAVQCAQNLGKSSVNMRIDLDGAIVVSSSSWDTSQNNFMIDGGVGYAANGANPGSALVMCPYANGCGPNAYPPWGGGGVLNPVAPVYNYVAGPPQYSPVEFNGSSSVSNDYCTANSLTCTLTQAVGGGAAQLHVAGMTVASLTVDSIIAFNAAGTALCSASNNCYEQRIKSVSGGSGGSCTSGSPCTVTLQGGENNSGSVGANGTQIFLYQANALVAIRAGYMLGQFGTNGFDQTLRNFDIDLEGASLGWALENETLQERSVFDGVHPVADWGLFPDTASNHRVSYNSFYSTGANSCSTGTYPTNGCLTGGPVGGGFLFQKTWQGIGDTAGPIHYVMRNLGVDQGIVPGPTATQDTYCQGNGSPCQITSPAVTITYPANKGYIPQCKDGTGPTTNCPTGAVFEGYSWFLNKPSTVASGIIEGGTNEGKVAPGGSGVVGWDWPIANWLDGVTRGVFMSRAEHFCTLFDAGELPTASYPGDQTSDMIFLAPSSCFEECTGTVTFPAESNTNICPGGVCKFSSGRAAKTDIELGNNTLGPNHVIGMNACVPATLYGIADPLNANFLLMSSNNPNGGGVTQIGEYKHDAQTTAITNANPNCTALTIGSSCTDIANGLVEYNNTILTISGGTINASIPTSGIVGFQQSAFSANPVLSVKQPANTSATGQFMIDTTAAWNAVGTTQKGYRWNVTDTASASGSLHTAFQIGLSDFFKIGTQQATEPGGANGTGPLLIFAGKAPSFSLNGTTPYLNLLSIGGLIHGAMNICNPTTTTLAIGTGATTICQYTLPGTALQWQWHCEGSYTDSNATTALTFQMATSNTPTRLDAHGTLWTANTGTQVNGTQINDVGTGAATIVTGTPGATGTFQWMLGGTIQPSATGGTTFTISALALAGSDIVLNADSECWIN